ncbi:DNA alkylation repair protein [Vibrio ulleungensis]|uniref:DNA alkylation repair protein n=1 Tax=Vibrio ulleungensis TaxID=2807619 RepID=A0ABS2HJC8_9VIBR|nr:DNA alkylation repair protein [Vibrio ulleungensis]MBM7037134.1 DNA alkylation repair protein [Vibrio ulleungensis]
MAGSEQAQQILKELAGYSKMGEIKKLAKTIKKDHSLALELWATALYFPRLLAVLIFDKKQLSEESINTIATDLASHPEDERNMLSDWLLANQLTKDKALTTLLLNWQQSSVPLLRRWFWYHQARLRWTGKTLPIDNSAQLLDYLDAHLADEEAQVQWAMNFCAGWIGIFEAAHRQRCIELGERVALYKDEKVSKNCTPSYLPEFIRIEVGKRGD